MPDIAKHVTVDLAQRKLYVNGEEFPYLVAEDGIQIDHLVARRGPTPVTVTFFTEDVEVVPAGSNSPTG
ncbi:hypothetical protein [Nocardia farcinica]|uniref:hypothetical protein n=1 Tax=Nocardia farcinica TaxID=37329 RepID=UPI00189623AE|nr:hypothetical protein [Nocardia farcinica]MBF6189439.1 hypothetical protein [Nocardia farcinica]MBF6363199.1 hypothetical protein [Nocardia farcinica]